MRTTSARNGPMAKPSSQLADFGAPSETAGSIAALPRCGDEIWSIQPPLTQVCKQLRSCLRTTARRSSLGIWDYGCGKGSGKKGLGIHSSCVKDWVACIDAANRALMRKLIVSNCSMSGTLVSAGRFAAALRAARVPLENSVIQVVHCGLGGMALRPSFRMKTSMLIPRSSGISPRPSVNGSERSFLSRCCRD